MNKDSDKIYFNSYYSFKLLNFKQKVNLGLVDWGFVNSGLVDSGLVDWGLDNSGFVGSGFVNY